MAKHKVPKWSKINAIQRDSKYKALATKIGNLQIGKMSLERELIKERAKTARIIDCLQKCHPIRSSMTDYRNGDRVLVARSANGTWSASYTVSRIATVCSTHAMAAAIEESLILSYWRELLEKAAELCQHHEYWSQITKQEVKGDYHMFNLNCVVHAPIDINERPYIRRWSANAFTMPEVPDA